MYQGLFKRTSDVVIASVVLIVTLPVSLIVGLLIKIESRGPILFVQLRTGLYGETFQLLKFRSMTTSNDVHDLTRQNQLTKIGKFIRRFSIDEIPQLINVIKGDMSLIGPRPWITEYYDHMNKAQRRRNDVRPGITGLAQAKGRNGLSINEKINYDLEYVEGISLTQDLTIIYLTINAVFNESGQEIEKHGIRAELDTLKYQNMTKRTSKAKGLMA